MKNFESLKPLSREYLTIIVGGMGLIYDGSPINTPIVIPNILPPQTPNYPVFVIGGGGPGGAGGTAIFSQPINPSTAIGVSVTGDTIQGVTGIGVSTKIMIP